MHFKDSKAQNQVDFPDFNKTNLSGWRFFFCFSPANKGPYAKTATTTTTHSGGHGSLWSDCWEIQVWRATPGTMFPGRLGIPPTMVVAALREFAPPKTLPKHHSGWEILVLWASFAKKKHPRSFFYSNQLNTIFCIGCLFVSFLLSFLAFLFTCLFFWFHLLLLGINNVSSHSSRFFLVEFSRQEDLCHRKAHRLGNISPNDQFQMDGTKSCLARVYRKFTTQLYRH